MEDNIPKVSVVVPTYNTAEYLPKCMDSIIDQNLKEIEIICVNDGSTDDSPDVLDQYALRDRRIRIIQKENGGLVSARKEGVMAARGDYVAFVDSDDWIEADMYEQLYQFAAQYAADMVTCGFFLEGNYTTVHMDTVQEGLYSGDSMAGLRAKAIYFIEKRSSGLKASLCYKLFKRELIQSAQCRIPNEITMAEDKMCLLTALLDSKSVYVYHKPFYHYRIRTDSMVHTGSEEYLIKVYEVYKYLKGLYSHRFFTGDMRRQAEIYIIELLYKGINTLLGFENSNLLWIDPYWLDKIPVNAKIILYGAGDLAEKYRKQLESRKDMQYIACIDFSYERLKSSAFPVVSPDVALNCDYDYIVITIKNPEKAQAVRKQLEQIGVSGDKILWEKCDIIKNITCIIDGNQRNQGKFIYGGHMLMVYGMEHLADIDWNDTYILILSDYYKEVYEKLEAWFGCGLQYGIEVFYYESCETGIEMSYRQEYADRALQDIIIFRSGPHASSYIKGMDFADNARALFEYALQTGLNRRYELVWFVKNPKEFKQYDHIENVRFLSFDWSVSDNQDERNAYYRALCLAKYIFFTDAYGFARNCRSDQIRVQLWHGCGFKTRVNFVRCENRYEYTTVISNLYADIHADIYGLRRDQVLVTGYAKQDWLFHPKQDDMSRLHIPEADKYIFWLPTFRSTQQNLGQLNEYCFKTETGLPIVDSIEKMDYLNTLLAEKNIVLVVKLHPFQDREMVYCGNCSNIYFVENEDLAAQDIPVNRLLGQADALISDYSSAAVDFMLLDRPIAFMLEDVERYERSRGFVFDNIRDWLPGKEIFSFDDMCAFVEEMDKGYDTTKDKRRMLRDKMHEYCDDNNCQRILGAFGILGTGDGGLPNRETDKF